MFNTNPFFDYGQFRQLHFVIQNTNMSVSFFANVFDEAGVFVFHDNADVMRETIVTVPKLGSSCPSGARMDAASPINLVKFDIAKLKVSRWLRFYTPVTPPPPLPVIPCKHSALSIRNHEICFAKFVSQVVWTARSIFSLRPNSW